MRNSTVSVLCTPDVGAATSELLIPQFEMYKILYPEGGVEFHIAHGDMIRLLRQHGFAIENLIELYAPAEASSRFEYITADWARQWPNEEIWVATKT